MAQRRKSGLLEGLPIDSKLADGGPKCAEPEILRAQSGRTVTRPVPGLNHFR